MSTVEGLMDEPFPPTPPSTAVVDDDEVLGDLKEVGRLPDWMWENPITEGQDNFAVYSFVPLYAPDGRLFLAAGGGDEVMRILSLDEGNDDKDQAPEIRIVSEHRLHTDSITRCALSSDKSMLAAASLDGKVSVYTLTLVNENTPLEAKHLTTFDGPAGEIEECVWSPKGLLLLATSSDGMAWLWHAKRGYHGVLVGHGDVVTKGAFVHCLDAQNNETIMVVTGSLDGHVIIWDPQTLTARHKLQIGPPNEPPQPIVALCVHQSEPLIVCGTADGYLHLIQATSGQRLRCVKMFDGEVADVQFAPNITRETVGDVQLAAADTEGIIKVIEGSTFAVRHTLRHGEGVVVNHLCWGPSWPPVLVSSGEDGTVRIWDPRSGEIKDTLAGTSALISDLCLFPIANPPALFVGAATEDGQILLWQL